MRSFCTVILILSVGWANSTRAADEARKKAEETWDAVGGGKSALHETKHFVVCAPDALGKRLGDIGEWLEKHHDKAKEALQFEIKEEAKGEVLPGKVIVYLFAEREQFTSFVRRIEGRRLSPDETASFAAADDKLHIAVSPPRVKNDLPIEIQACEQAASLLMARRAGVSMPLPDWLTAGFGRATYYRVAPRDKAVLADRALAAKLARRRNASDIWDGKLSADEAETLQGSLANYLAYGPAARAFPKFLAGFMPGDNMASKTTGQAFDAAGIKPDALSRAWKLWAVSIR